MMRHTGHSALSCSFGQWP